MMNNDNVNRHPCQNRYSEVLKKKVCREYLENGLSICYLSKKYQIAGHHTIKRWLRIFADESIMKEAQDKMVMAKSKKEDLPMTMEQMKKRIRELKRQLEDAELKVELNEKIIEIAEEQLNIQIRKKSDTK
jgi:transposase